MKNCLIVIVVLTGCAAIAGWLALHPQAVLPSSAPRDYMIATWRDYTQDNLYGLEVTVGTDRMFIDVPAVGQSKRTEVAGHWNLHAFYVDSHLDSPPEFEVARELKNEDLEVDIGRFLPAHQGKIVCVKVMRLIEDRPPYPMEDPNVKVTYPPPKGLIRVGMLECDLQTLPWHVDHVEMERGPERGPPPGGGIYVGPGAPHEIPHEQPHIYTYRSDREGVPQLLVRVYEGRVIEVMGGAEETSDIPYQLPASTSPADNTPVQTNRGWREWLFDLIFAK